MSKDPTGTRAGIRSLPFAFLAVALLALLWAAGPALAHGEQFARAEKIWPLLDEEQMPEELEGVRIGVEHSYYGTWIRATNDTGEPLEVYDDNGEPFLRIGPDGVEYNRWAEEYYVTKAEPGTELRRDPPDEVTDNPEAAPEWVRLSDAPSAIWRDLRVDTKGMDPAQWAPMEVRRAKEDADVGTWSIPVRLGEVESEVQGTYRYDAPQKGDFAAIMTSEPANPEITVMLLHGAAGESSDALTLKNRSGEPVTIFGAFGEPAIRVGPKEVQMNVNSPVGRSADLDGSSADAAEPLETAEPEWKTIVGGSHATWLDPRLRSPDGQPQPDDPETVQEVGRWEIPIEVAGEQELLAGTIEWQPADWQPPEPPATEEPGIDFREVATVGAVTVVPALAIMALLIGPGLYKRYRYRR